MFDIGWSELLVIAVVAIIVVGPRDLPKLMRSIGHYAGKLRRAAADFQRQFEDAMRESEVEEVRKAIQSVKVDGPPAAYKTPIDQPVMLPKPDAAARAQAKPKPQRKRGSAKPKTASAKRGKKPAEPAP
jgi:sec-independent protein translocase protein TatB